MPEYTSPPSLFPPASLVLTLAGGAAAFVLLYLLSQSDYLLFHSIIEITTIVIGFSIFVLVINARKYIDNSYFFVIGIGFLFICTIDLVHTLAYKGMGVFPAATADLPTQLWIAGRFLQAATLLAAPLVIGRKVRLPVLFAGYAAVTALLLGSIWYGIFPHCFIEGQGLTPFKIWSEYLISFLLVLATIALYHKREYFDPRIFRLLAAANFLTIGAELAFTSYISVYGFMNMLGHLFRLAATACFYMGFLVIGQEQPCELLWYHIRQKDKELKDLNATLADRVAERTRELEDANIRLKEEIDERKHAEESLRLANAYNRNLIEASLDPLVMINPDGTISDVNAATVNVTGISREELIGTDFSNYFTEPAKAREGYRRVFSEGKVLDYPLEIRHRDGNITPVLFNATVYHDSDGNIKGVFAAARDITERRAYEQKLKQFNEDLEKKVEERTLDLNTSLDEKILLLREIHHRVKNNLQIIISILNLQSRYIGDEKTLGAIRESQNRVRVMALVHEKLINSPDISKINLGEYIQYIVNNLYRFPDMNRRQIAFQTDIEKISVDINTAIPIGLIMNELMSNSFKHAFPDGRAGEISISVKKDAEALWIIYKDNGVGIPDNINWKTPPSLGLRLVNTLMEQLRGSIELDKREGSLFRIMVPDDPEHFK